MSNPSSPSFSMNRLPWLIALVAIVALAYTWWQGRTPKATADDAQLAALQQRLNELEQRSPTARPQPSGMPQQAGAMQSPSALGMHMLSAEEAKAKRDQEAKELEAQFNADAPDPNGRTAEFALEKTSTSQVMASTGIKAKDVDVACKMHGCRTVATLGSEGDAQDWGLFYITSAGGKQVGQSRMVFLPQPDGSTQVKIYSTRPK